MLHKLYLKFKQSKAAKFIVALWIIYTMSVICIRVHNAIIYGINKVYIEITDNCAR